MGGPAEVKDDHAAPGYAGGAAKVPEQVGVVLLSQTSPGFDAYLPGAGVHAVGKVQFVVHRFSNRHVREPLLDSPQTIRETASADNGYPLTSAGPIA